MYLYIINVKYETKVCMYVCMYVRTKRLQGAAVVHKKLV